MAFTGKTAFVVGGTGIVGSGIVNSFLNQGAKVVVSSRNQSSLDELKTKTDEKYRNNLILIQGDPASETDIQAIVKRLQSEGGVHHVASAIGGWEQTGTLTKSSLEDFDRNINLRAKTHFILAKYLLPELAKTDGSSYTFISGMMGERCTVPDAAMLAVSGACLYGVAQAAMAEFRGTGVTVNELRIGLFIKPQLTKDLPATVDVGPRTFDQIGHDVIGDIVLGLARARTSDVIKLNTRTEALDKLKQVS